MMDPVTNSDGVSDAFCGDDDSQTIGELMDRYDTLLAEIDSLNQQISAIMTAVCSLSSTTDHRDPVSE